MISTLSESDQLKLLVEAATGRVKKKNSISINVLYILISKIELDSEHSKILSLLEKSEFIKTIIQMFEPLILILQRPSKSLLGNANMEIKILEEFRLKIVEFFLGCIESNNADIIKAIIQYHVLPEIINLFFTFENNSMLHNIIEKIIEISIKSFNDNEELLKIILIEGKLLKRLCNGCINKGYSGHLIKIGNELLKISENNEHLANFISQRKN